MSCIRKKKHRFVYHTVSIDSICIYLFIVYCYEMHNIYDQIL